MHIVNFELFYGFVHSCVVTAIFIFYKFFFFDYKKV